MTRVYRDQPLGITYVERGTGGPLLVLADHGDPDWQWASPNLSTLVYDDELYAVENDHLTEVRDQLLQAVGELDIAATAKSRVRTVIGEVIK